MAVKDLFKGGSTQSKLDDVQARLRTINTELDALNITSVPTSDLEVEEANALKRLARIEALRRVSSALSAEQAELNAKLLAEKEAEKQRQIVALQAEINAAKAKAIDELWASYQAVKAWEVLDTGMQQFKETYGVAGREARDIGDIVADILARLKAANVSMNAHTMQRTVERATAK